MNTSTIITLLKFEEGWREKPYIDTRGYPTVGYGFLIGPRHAALSNYTFRLPESVGETWLNWHVRQTVDEMKAVPAIKAALDSCLESDKRAMWYNPRAAVLISMAYQMGVDGLTGFRNTLLHIKNQDWFQAETGMLKSKWANQTPKRARRHAEQMRAGQWHPEYT